MEWLGSIKGSIDYIEKHLLEDISAQDVAKEQNMSPFYLQQGFRLMTGYTIGEYIRNRRLYLAGLEAFSGKMKVIDLAYRYGYDTPESFAKAFKRFHGVSPAQIRGDSSKIKVFLPLKISIILQGGFDMEYTAEKMSSFSVVGFEREFSFETSYRDIPQYWQEIFQTYQKPMMEGKKPETDIQKAMCEYRIGLFGVCLDGDAKDGRFRYLIAGKYNGGAVPDGRSYGKADAKGERRTSLAKAAGMPGLRRGSDQPDYRTDRGPDLLRLRCGHAAGHNYRAGDYEPGAQ